MSKQMGGNFVGALVGQVTSLFSEKEKEKSPMQLLTDSSISLHKNLMQANKEGRYTPDLIV